MSSSTERVSVIPASLSFLTIYNPSLSHSDETFRDQVLYHYSDSKSEGRTRRNANNEERGESKEEENEKLRQIGLAQGMVGFAKNFSNGKSVNAIETEKSRIILHEFEKDWWILASINLTRIPVANTVQNNDQALQAPQQPQVPFEYSAREVSPSDLLLQQLLRAHGIFLLHHSSSIIDLFTRTSRKKFCSILKRFWDDFIRKWDVLLHGNPAIDIFNGIKLAAGGELGVGVGEEEWGSGEREVLEGFVHRTDGLVDLLVSRFGDDASHPSERPSEGYELSKRNDMKSSLQDQGTSPQPPDGLIFSGVGALSRATIKSISNWTEWLHMYGRNAYGARDNPSAPRRKRRVAMPNLSKGNKTNKTDIVAAEGAKIPPSIVATTSPSKNLKSSAKEDLNDMEPPEATNMNEAVNTTNSDALIKYLTLGVYGSSWGIPSGRPQSREVSRAPSASSQQQVFNSSRSLKAKSSGYFLIGLQGPLDEEAQFPEDEVNSGVGDDHEITSADEEDYNSRISKRTVYAERVREPNEKLKGQIPPSGLILQETFTERLRIVVYVRKPFIFTFLFDLQADSLEMPSFYRSLHYQLGPLQKPLLSTTSPQKVKERLWKAISPQNTTPEKISQPIRDLVYDPVRLTIHTTIQNIPEPANSDPSSWTRIEAINVHSQILNTYSSTRQRTSELEQTSKTSRGYWVVWMRLPDNASQQSSWFDGLKEAFLVRRASDYVAPNSKKPSGKFNRDVSGSDSGGMWTPGKLAEGIGIDARQYIDSLLSLNR